MTRFERIGKSIDDTITDIINWYLKSFIYRTYARHTIRRHVEKHVVFESIEHLAYTLKYAVINGWLTNEEASKLAKKWRDDTNATN